MSLEKHNTCLRLNSQWAIIGTSSMKEAIISLNSEPYDKEGRAALALDIGYKRNPDGSYDFETAEYIRPVDWDTWVTLPVREFDDAIHTPRLTIRVPRVVIAVNFNKVIMRKPRLTPKAIMERDNYRCGYTGEILPKHLLNLDHITPLSRGGSNDWTNITTCAKEVNSKKGDRTPAEAGLKLLKQPRAPMPSPVSFLIKEIKHPDWKFFIHK